MERVLVLVSFFLVGCLSSPPVPPKLPPFPKDGERGFVISMWEQTGAFGLVETSTRTIWPMQGPTSSDATARYFEGRIYVINRYTHDNLQIMDSTTLGLIKQISVGPGSNPQDLVVIGQDLWLTRLNEPSLLRMDKDTGAILDTLDLSELSELSEVSCRTKVDCPTTACLRGFCTRDGLPELAGLHFDGQSLVITAQRLDRNETFAAKDRGMLAFFDVRQKKIVETLEMAAGNPLWQQASLDGQTLYVGQTGRWLASDGTSPELDGVIEAFDLPKRRSSGILLREKDLGGNLSGFVIVSASLGYAIRSGSSWQTDLVAFDPSKGKVTKTVARSACVEATACFSFFQIALNKRGELYLVDRNPQAPGLRVFDALTGQEITKAPLSMGLPPSFLLFFP